MLTTVLVDFLPAVLSNCPDNMHISKLTLVNYRNFQNTSLTFKKGINTVIGENGSGKSNLFRAIRLLLDENMVKAAFRLEETDFYRGLKNWKGQWIIISVEFEEITADESIQALFLHSTAVVGTTPISKATYNLIFRPKKEFRLRMSKLSVGDKVGLDAILKELSIDDYETIFTGRSVAKFDDPNLYSTIVGDFDNVIFSKETEFPDIGSKTPVFLSLTKEVSFTYVQALRDVVAEFHNNRTNPLFSLLKSKSGDINPAVMAPIVDMVEKLNVSIEDLDDVRNVRNDIFNTIKETAGETYSPSTLSIKSDLPTEAEQLFQSLRLFVGESNDGYQGTINELSLGGANLIFLTLKLLEFKYQKEKKAIANFLIVEEPEAHIHTHIQKTLFDKMRYAETQIIYSTHSTHISEVSAVENVNILGRKDGRCEAYQPTTGLSPTQIGDVQRYLDAVRSNLLFARSVILVEGDAEEILVPIMVKKFFGVSLDELGISLVNIRSTGFQNVAVLFNDTRIRKRCAIVTDLDKAFIDTVPVVGESAELAKYKAKCFASAKAGLERKEILDKFVAANQWLAVYYSTHTFEVDFIAAGNAMVVECIVDKIYKDAATIAASKLEISSGDKAQYGKRVLTMAKQEGKGWFAIRLGEKVDWTTKLPSYLLQAVTRTHYLFEHETFVTIISYRVNLYIASTAVPSQALIGLTGIINDYRNLKIDLSTIRAAYLAALPSDQLNEFLAVFP